MTAWVYSSPADLPREANSLQDQCASHWGQQHRLNNALAMFPHGAAGFR
jgi:hypothetical protein